MKSRDAYDKVEEKNHTEEFSVELEEVFFDSVSDHFEEQRRDWPEWDENNTYERSKTDGETEETKLKKRGTKKKKHKQGAQQQKPTSTQQSAVFTGSVVERSKPRSVLREENGEKETENRFFAELKLLKEHLQKKEQDLCVINFSNCQIGKKKARLIASALTSATGFELTASFDCSNNILKNAGTRILAQALRESNISFILLDLSNNKIGDDGACFLFKSLESQRVLATVNLCCNDIGPAGAKALVEYVEKNPTCPESIDISCNHIGDNGAFDIAEMLPSKSQNIQWLNLCNNSIGIKGTEALISSLAEISSSKCIKHFHLDLSDNYYSKEVLNTVEQLRKENSKLEIVLSQNYLLEDSILNNLIEKNNHLQYNEAEEEFDSTAEGWCNSESVQDIFNAANIIEAWQWNREKTVFCPEQVIDAYERIIRYLDEELNESNHSFPMLSPEESLVEPSDIHYRNRAFDSTSEVCDLPPAVRATVELLDILMHPIFDDLFEGCLQEALIKGEELFEKCYDKEEEGIITPYTICSQSRIVFPRLGYSRLKCIEVVWKLVCFRFECIDNLLSYQGILSRCLELVSEFPQNNCFQIVLLKIFEEAFSTERNSDILMWALICPCSFASNTAYNVLDVVRDVYTLNSFLNQKFPKVGNLSALSTVSRFARLVKEKADQVEQVRTALESNKEWHKLREDIFPKLLDMASSYPLGDELCCLGGKKPTRTSFSSAPQIDWAAIFRGFPGNSFSRLSLGR